MEGLFLGVHVPCQVLGDPPHEAAVPGAIVSLGSAIPVQDVPLAVT